MFMRWFALTLFAVVLGVELGLALGWLDWR